MAKRPSLRPRARIASLFRCLTVIGLSIFMAFSPTPSQEDCLIRRPLRYRPKLFLLGLIIRWIAIIHPGRFFTVNVAIADDHQLITTGFRRAIHPIPAP